MTSRLTVLAASLTISLAATSCSPAPSSGDGTEPAKNRRIVLTGSSTMAPLMSEIGKRFESQHPGVRVDVQTGGSSRGIADARRRLADIGMVSRSLKPDEGDLRGFAVGHDGVCLIVHSDNPVESLTDEQVVAMYTGRIREWNEVGGHDAPITVVNKAEGRSTLELFLSHYQLESPEIRADVIIGDNEQGVKTVAGNPAAIAYVSIGTAEYDAAHGVPIRLLPLNGVEASVENVRGGTFPLSRPLHLVTRAPPEGLVREFIEFARSEQVHDLVREQYFVPIDK